MDLIFNENLIMLISVYIPILYTMIVMLEDKKAETIIPAIEKMIAAHKREGRNVTLVRVDGEGEIVQHKTQEFLMIRHGVEVDKMGERSHAIPTLNKKTWKNVELEQVYPHYPLEMVLVAKKNDKTNRTSNENMVEALLLVAPNINIKKGKTPEFTYLALDTLKQFTG